MRSRFLCVMLLASSLISEAPNLLGQPPVGRRTIDLDQDLFQALVNANRFADAIELCQARSRGADPRSDLAAKWAVRTSQALSAKQLVNDLNKKRIKAYYFADTDAIIAFLVKKAAPGDAILIMSNGGFDNIHQRLIQALQN